VPDAAHAEEEYHTDHPQKHNRQAEHEGRVKRNRTRASYAAGRHNVFHVIEGSVHGHRQEQAAARAPVESCERDRVCRHLYDAAKQCDGCAVTFGPSRER
jgi:hypothetical protein